ncbi:MAG: hypothetical protein ACLFNM_03530 [Candidatus Woesearchaeota archaeon]
MNFQPIIEHATYILLLIVSFASIYIGTFLARWAFDETNAMQKWFLLCENILLALTLFIIIIFYPQFIAFGLIVLSALFILVFWKKTNHNTIDYIIIAILTAFSTSIPEAFIYTITILFLFGFLSSMHKAARLFAKPNSVARELTKKQTKILKKELKEHYKWYPLIAVATYILCQVTTKVIVLIF